MEHVGPEEAQRMIEEGEAVLIDCRESYEFEEMRIAGAKLVPLSEYESQPALVEQAPKVIFQCATGNRSQTASAIFEAQHPGSTAYNLDGGIVAWVNTGLPFEMGPA